MGQTVWVGAFILILLAAVANPAAAEVPPAEPYGQLVTEVMNFLFADIGNGGIRTNDNDPRGYPVPPYFYHYAIKNNNDLWSSIEGYPGYASVSYPAYTASVGIDAFLDYRRYSGDEEGLNRAREFAEWILAHRTPAADLYGKLPYSTQTDGVMGGGWDGEAIMTDKPAMFGLRLLRLYDITGEDTYWQGAREIADVLAANQMTGPPEDHGRWPFRVRPSDGLVTQDYTSHLQPAVRFFDEMAQRTGNSTYTEVRDRAWQWLLLNPCNPASISYNRWEAFYEDQDPDMQTWKQDHYSAHEMIVELIERKPFAWQITAAAILDSAAVRYIDHNALSPYVPVTLEWEGWPQATYAATLQFARTALLLYQALEDHPLQDLNYKLWAYAMAANCSHGQNFRCVLPDGRMFTTIRDILYPYNIDSWYEQNFNTVKYYLELMNLDPTLAADNEHHMLWSDHAIRNISYPRTESVLRYEVAGGEGQERLKLAFEPTEVRAAGSPLSVLSTPDDPGPGYHWDHSSQVLTVIHSTDPVEILVQPVSLGVHHEDTEASPSGVNRLVQLESYPNPFNPQTLLTYSLPAAGPMRLSIHDVRGKLLAVLDEGVRPAGRSSIVWTGKDGNGALVASGVYFARLETVDRIHTRKLMLAR
jgi:hypothetical protein